MQFFLKVVGTMLEAAQLMCDHRVNFDRSGMTRLDVWRMERLEKVQKKRRERNESGKQKGQGLEDDGTDSDTDEDDLEVFHNDKPTGAGGRNNNEGVYGTAITESLLTDPSKKAAGRKNSAYFDRSNAGRRRNQRRNQWVEAGMGKKRTPAGDKKDAKGRILHFR
jgi:hypothetical protein